MRKLILAACAPLVGFEVAFAQPVSGSNLFPQIEDTVKVSRFAGNWQVTLSGIPDQDDHETFISIEAPIEHYCEPLSGLTCRYKIRYDRSKEMSASYIGAGNSFLEKFVVSSERVLLDHAPGVVGHWGAESNLRFGGGSASGTWKYGDDRGSETWTRLNPTINRVEFTAIDAGRDGASIESDAPVVTGTADDNYYGWGEGNRAPGTRPRFHIRIFGDHLWGFHIFDVKSGDGLQTGNCYQIHVDTSAQNHGVIGLQCDVLLWPGVENGPKILRLDNLDIPFRLNVDGLNEENKDLKLLVANSTVPDTFWTSVQLPGRPSSDPSDTSLFADIKNYGEKTAPALLVDLAHENPDHKYKIEYCDQSGFECDPCDARSDGQSYLCPSANLDPNQSARLRVNVTRDTAQDGQNAQNTCPPASDLSLSARGYEDGIIEEENQSDNSARFNYHLKQFSLDYIELLAQDVSEAYDDEAFESSLYPLETLYPYGSFVAKLHLTAPVCDLYELGDIEFAAEITDGSTGRRELKLLRAELTEDGDALISESLGEDTSAPGTVFSVSAQDKRARAVVEPITPGTIRLSALDRVLDQKREILSGQGARLDYVSPGNDLRNVSKIELDGYVFEGDIEDKKVSVLTTLAGKEFDFDRIDMTVENVGGGRFSRLLQVPTKTPQELHDRGASIAVDTFGHAPQGPRLDRLEIVDGMPPEIISLAFRQGTGDSNDKLIINEPFVLEAKLKSEIPGRTSLFVSLDINSQDAAQIGANQEIIRELTVSEDDASIYRAEMMVLPYTNEPQNKLQGLEGDIIFAYYDDEAVAAALTFQDGVQRLTVNAVNGLGQKMSARGRIEVPFNASSTVPFVTNRVQVLKNRVKGPHELLAEFPGCCIYKSVTDLPDQDENSLTIPPLARVRVQTGALTSRQLSEATLVAQRDAFASFAAPKNRTWRMTAESGNFQSGKALTGLDLPPGSYNFWLIHPEMSLKLETRQEISSGVTDLHFSGDGVSEISREDAEPILKRGTTRFETLDETSDFDGDGIPNEIDPKPREFSNILFHEDSTINARIVDRGGNKVIFIGHSGSSYSIEVIPEGDQPTQPALVEVLGVTLELEPGTILEVAFG